MIIIIDFRFDNLDFRKTVSSFFYHGILETSFHFYPFFKYFFVFPLDINFITITCWDCFCSSVWNAYPNPTSSIMFPSKQIGQEMREFSHTENGRLPVHRWISTVVLVLAGRVSVWGNMAQGFFQHWNSQPEKRNSRKFVNDSDLTGKRFSRHSVVDSIFGTWILKQPFGKGSLQLKPTPKSCLAWFFLGWLFGFLKDGKTHQFAIQISARFLHRRLPMLVSRAAHAASRVRKGERSCKITSFFYLGFVYSVILTSGWFIYIYIYIFFSGVSSKYKLYSNGFRIGTWDMGPFILKFLFDVDVGADGSFGWVCTVSTKNIVPPWCYLQCNLPNT